MGLQRVALSNAPPPTVPTELNCKANLSPVSGTYIGIAFSFCSFKCDTSRWIRAIDTHGCTDPGNRYPWLYRSGQQIPMAIQIWTTDTHGYIAVQIWTTDTHWLYRSGQQIPIAIQIWATDTHGYTDLDNRYPLAIQIWTTDTHGWTTDTHGYTDLDNRYPWTTDTLYRSGQQIPIAIQIWTTDTHGYTDLDNRYPSGQQIPMAIQIWTTDTHGRYRYPLLYMDLDNRYALLYRSGQPIWI